MSAPRLRPVADPWRGEHAARQRERKPHRWDEEKKYAAMVLEWICRQDRTFCTEMKDNLFTDKPIAHQ